MKPVRNVPDPQIHLAKTVRDRRKELGLTQAEVARRSGFARTYYVGVEAGRQTTMSVYRAERLANTLRLSVSQLTGNQPVADRTSLEIAEELVAQISRDTIKESACRLEVMGSCVDKDMVMLDYVGFLVLPKAPLEEIVGSRDLKGIYLLRKAGDVTYEDFRNWDLLLCRESPGEIQDGSLCVAFIDGFLALRRVNHESSPTPIVVDTATHRLRPSVKLGNIDNDSSLTAIEWGDVNSDTAPIRIECPGDVYDGRMISSSQIKGIVLACMPRPYSLNRSK